MKGLEKGKSGFSSICVGPEAEWSKSDSLCLWEAGLLCHDVDSAHRGRSAA